MDDKTWERYGALGGIWFLVLGVIGSLLAGTPPGRTDSADEIAVWFLDNDTNIQIGAFLTGIGVIGLAWWFGSLWQAMVRAEDGSLRVAVIALAGFSMSGAMAMGGFAVNAATASGIELVGTGSAFFFGLSSVLYGFAAIGTAIMVLAVSGLVWRTGFLPKWIAEIGVIIAALEIVSALGVATDANFFGLVGFIAFVAWAIWNAIVGWLLYQGQAAITATADA